MYAFNFDTIWIGGQTGFNGPHLWLTTNGGLNWIKKFELPSGSQFDRIYFYNKRIGFCSTPNGIYKTTNGGDNWFQVSTETFTTKIQFVDSLTGWKCDNLNYSMKKTTDGGYNWITQTLPSGGLISESGLYDFFIINKDTIWGCGGQMYISPIFIRKGLIYKTINGGVNWGYQLPDTNLVNKFDRYFHIYFINNKIGWVYDSDSNSFNKLGGVHTTTGGFDSTIYVDIKQQIAKISNYYELFQNYPNPFNPTTNIKYQLPKNSFVNIIIYDMLGRQITTLINSNQKQGSYDIQLNMNDYNLSSGLYFYTVTVNEISSNFIYRETKVMSYIK